MEEVTNHVDTAVLNVSRLGVFLVVDEVFGEGLSHEFLSFFLLFTKPYQSVENVLHKLHTLEWVDIVSN